MDQEQSVPGTTHIMIPTKTLVTVSHFEQEITTEKKTQIEWEMSLEAILIWMMLEKGMTFSLSQERTQDFMWRRLFQIQTLGVMVLFILMGGVNQYPEEERLSKEAWMEAIGKVHTKIIYGLAVKFYIESKFNKWINAKKNQLQLHNFIAISFLYWVLYQNWFTMGNFFICWDREKVK